MKEWVKNSYDAPNVDVKQFGIMKTESFINVIGATMFSGWRKNYDGDSSKGKEIAVVVVVVVVVYADMWMYDYLSLVFA